MTINSDNFEAYMLDYLEGNLDPLLTADLMAFLAENPAYENLLPDYDRKISLSDSHEYAQKELLKREFADLPAITFGNFDEFCIAACEGLLGNSDRVRLSDFIALHPGRQRDLDLYGKIRLQPDLSVSYPEKLRLKKKGAPLASRYLYISLGIAASIALLVMLAVRKPAGSVYSDSTPAAEEGAKNTVRTLTPFTPGQATPAAQPVKAMKTAQFRLSNLETPPSVTPQPEPLRETLTLNPLKPITGKSLAIAEPPGITGHLSKSGSNKQPAPRNNAARELTHSFSDSFPGTLLVKVDFWKTAETAIHGFNYLTESQLSIDKTTDENGKVTGLLLGMESYEITGNKIK